MTENERRLGIVFIMFIMAVVLGAEHPSDERRDPERLEVVPRDDSSSHSLGLLPAEQDEVHVVVLDDGVERTGEGLDVVDVGEREPCVGDVGSRLVQEQQVFAAIIRQRPQEDGVHDAENGSVGADPECHRHDYGQRVARLPAQAAEAVAEVLCNRLDEARQPGVADVVFDTLDAAESLARGAAGGVWRDPPPHVVGREHVEVKLQLDVELAFHRAAAEDGADALQPGRHGGCRDQGSEVCRIRVTASVIRAQFSRSSVNCLRPVRVSR